MANEREPEITYEEAIRRLEEVVARLENEDIPLEESLACFQEGIKLSRYCREKLAEVEYRVEYLLKEETEDLSGGESGNERTGFNDEGER